MLNALGLRRKPPPQSAMVPVSQIRPIGPVELLARRYHRILYMLYGRMKLIGGGPDDLRLVARGARHLSLGIRLKDPTQVDKALKLSKPLSIASRCPAVLAYDDGSLGLVIYQYQLPSDYWESYTRDDVTGSGLGLGEMRHQVNFSLDEAPHAGIFGTTNSGKSETIKSALVALTGAYTPDQMRLVLIDPHHDFDAFANIAHLAIPVSNTPDEIDNALLYANQIYEHRENRNARDDHHLVVVIEEGDQLLFGNKLRLGIVSNLTNGRKFKVNVILGCKKPLHSELPGILDNLINRFIGQVSDPNISYQLSGRGKLRLHQLSGKGDFFHVNGGIVERFQVAKATERDYARLPRAEVPAAPQVDPAPAITLPEAKPGRPANELQPDTLALYLDRGPDNISYRQAQGGGITRTAHILHRNFALDLLTELQRLGLHLCGGEA